MRNPNGYGSVVKLSGNRRKPWAVRKTTGWNEKGYPIYLSIGYAETREEGLIMLAEYNRSPYDVDLKNITVSEVYEKWSKRDYPKMNTSTVYALKSAWKHCSAVYNLKYSNLKAFHMQDCIDACGRGASTQGQIKALFWHLDKYALELDIIDKCYSSLVTTEVPNPKIKTPFSDEEIKKLWNAVDKEWVDSVLFFLYTGFRISEMLSIENKNVDLDKMTITGGTKTKAGKNRIVPIHPKIQDVIKKRYSEINTYLFTIENKKITPSIYYRIWDGIMDDLSMKHNPHECRHTFRSKLDSAGANKKCIDLLMGHTSKDIGERVYTHKTLDELKNTINLLP